MRRLREFKHLVGRSDLAPMLLLQPIPISSRHPALEEDAVFKFRDIIEIPRKNPRALGVGAKEIGHLLQHVSPFPQVVARGKVQRGDGHITLGTP